MSRAAVSFSPWDFPHTSLPPPVAQKGKATPPTTRQRKAEGVRAANQALKATGARDIAIFHCTSMYPTPHEHINLRAMQTLAKEFGLPTGLSDHSEGTAISIAAGGLGAKLIEKHYTLSRAMPGPDHKASLEPGELKEMIVAIRAVEAALGSPEKKPVGGEIDTARVARKSVVARRDIKAGNLLSLEDVYIVRPGTGIPPKHEAEVVGKTAKSDIARGTPLQWNMLS